MDRNQRNGLLLILVAAAGYAFFPIFTKTIFDIGGMEPLDVLIARFLLATPITWALMWVRHLRSNGGEAVTDRSLLPRVQLLGMGVIFVLTAGSAFFVLSRLPASTYTVILYSYPAMVALLSLLLGERLSARAWMALALTVVGILLTVPDFSAGLGDIEGIFVGLLNAGFYAVYIVLSGRILRGHTDLAGASAWSITGSFLFLVFLAVFRGLEVPPNLAVWGWLFALATFSTVIPVFAFYGGMQKLGAARAAILSTIEPVFTLVLAVILLGERIDLIQLLGAALILGSVILLQSGNLRRKNTPLAADAGGLNG